MAETEGGAAAEEVAQEPQEVQEQGLEPGPAELQPELAEAPPAGAEGAPVGAAADAGDPAAPPAAGADLPADAAASEADALVEQAEEAIAEDVSELARLASERDEYRNQLLRLQADFENYKKRITRQQTEHLERATEELVSHLLPVLDTFDLALAHGTEGLEPVYRSLLDILESSGLQRLDPLGQPFDPNEHDAVLHEQADDGSPASPEVTEVLRAGYRWKGRVMRPAMVKVKG